MSATAITIIASAAQTAAGSGAAIAVPGVKEMLVVADVTATSGTITAFGIWLQTSVDAGVTWADLPADVLLTSATAATQTTSVLTGSRLYSVATTPVPNRYTGQYSRFGSLIRAAWTFTGTPAYSVTFSVKAVGK